MIDFIKRAGIASAVACVPLLAAAPAATADYRVKATIKCNNRGDVERLPRIKVELWEENFGPNNSIMTVFTDEDGELDFVVDTDQVDAQDDVEVYLKLFAARGFVKVTNWWNPAGGPQNVETAKVHNGDGLADFGTRVWRRDEGKGTPPCALLLGAQEEVESYRADVGTPIPYYVDIQHHGPNAGVPWAPWNDIIWPTGYATEDKGEPPYTTLAHEFGHTVRHWFDGDEAHFSEDVFAHFYGQTHSNCKVTNDGFAFNEGWAAYWAGSFAWCTDTHHDDRQEGNVAARLAIAEDCSDRRTLVRTLTSAPGEIHSIGEFLQQMKSFDEQCAVKARLAEPPEESTSSSSDAITAEPEHVSPDVLSREVMARFDVSRGQVRRLDGALAGALRRDDPQPCRSARGCEKAVEAVVRPAVMRAHLEQAKGAQRLAQRVLEKLRAVDFAPTPQVALELQAARNEFAAAAERHAREGLADARRALDQRARLGRRFRRGASRFLGRLRHPAPETKAPAAFVLDASDPAESAPRARR